MGCRPDGFSLHLTAEDHKERETRSDVKPERQSLVGFKPRKQPEPACKQDECTAQPHVFGYCYAHAERSLMITMIVDLKSQLHKANTKIGRLESGIDDCASWCSLLRPHDGDCQDVSDPRYD